MPQAIPFVMAATAIAGVGMQYAGQQQQQRAASQQAQAAANTAAAERKIEAQRRQAMELDARRKQMEAIRNQSRARALALSNATSQGAQFGSGLQGGYGQISGATETNLLGISQNLEIGANIFGINEDVTQNRMNSAFAGSQMAAGAGLSSLGGSLVSSMGPIGRLAAGIFPGSSRNVSNIPVDYTGNFGGIY